MATTTIWYKSQEDELRAFLRTKYHNVPTWLIEQFIAQAKTSEQPIGPKAVLEIPISEWHVQHDEAGKPERFTTWIRINGVDMHLTAIRRGRIDSKTGEYLDSDELEKVAQGVEPDGPFSAITVQGRKFVLVATPFVE